MSARNDVPPETIGIELTDDGVVVEYNDSREVLYRGAPEKVTESVRTGPGKDVHVLVTDETEQRGVLVYVNDLNTHDDILETSGVGRIMLDDGESDELFPGVDVVSSAYRVEVEVDHSVVDGRVFVFEEDELGERSFEVVAAD